MGGGLLRVVFFFFWGCIVIGVGWKKGGGGGAYKRQFTVYGFHYPDSDPDRKTVRIETLRILDFTIRISNFTFSVQEQTNLRLQPERSTTEWIVRIDVWMFYFF